MDEIIYDVAIVGSGPSGALTALRLLENGLNVCLIEKEILPRYKTCGGGFVYRARRNFPIDISSIVEREFSRVDSYYSKGLYLSVQREKPIITMVMRDTFDHLIIQRAVDLGLNLFTGHKLVDLKHEEDFVKLITSQATFKAKTAIAADGVLSPTAKLAGWNTETRHLIPALEYEVEVNNADFERLSKTVRFDFDAIPSGYAWCFPKKNHLSLGILTTKKKRINLRKYYREYLLTLGIEEVVSETQHGFQIPLAPRTDGFVKNRVFLIGDAAGFAEPITAEGISNAIYSGELVAKAISESGMDVVKAASIYEELLSQKLLPELKSGRLLANFFYNNNPVRNFLLKKIWTSCCGIYDGRFYGR